MAFKAAYWISPRGEILNVGTSHIAEVLKNPEKFGLDENFIKIAYDKFNERLGVEGKARAFIILHIFKYDWIRIRRYNNFWSINVNSISKKIRDYLTLWARKTLKGFDGYQEYDPSMIVNIDVSIGKSVKTSMKKLASGLVEPQYEKDDKNQYTIKIVTSANDLETPKEIKHYTTDAILEKIDLFNKTQLSFL